MTALICQSLVSGDATCTRTFMGNGQYRAHQALLELRSSAQVSLEGYWRSSARGSGSRSTSWA